MRKWKKKEENRKKICEILKKNIGGNRETDGSVGQCSCLGRTLSEYRQPCRGVPRIYIRYFVYV